MSLQMKPNNDPSPFSLFGKIVEISKGLPPILYFGILFVLVSGILFIAFLSADGQKASDFRFLIIILALFALFICLFYFLSSKPVPDSEETTFIGAGAILYANIVGFSKIASDERNEVIGKFRSACEQISSRFSGTKLDFNEREALFYFDEIKSRSAQEAMKRAFEGGVMLHRTQNGFELGTVLHWSDSATVTKFPPNTRIQGDAIHCAKRIMEFSDGGHFFITETAFGQRDSERLGFLRSNINSSGEAPCKHIKQAATINTNDDDLYYLEDLVMYDRHHLPYEFSNFYITRAGKIIIGNERRPPEWVKIEQRDILPFDNPTNRFVRLLAENSKVYIVGFTHEKTRYYIKEALELRKGNGADFWEKLFIVFPSERILDLVLEQDRSQNARKNEWENSKRETLTYLEGLGQECVDRWSCLECDHNFTFWGNLLVKDDKTRMIRVAPLIPGPDLKKLNYLTFYPGMDGYNHFSEAIDVMIAGSSSITEWDMFGYVDDENGQRFRYGGICNRSRLNDLPDRFWMPVVLVVLHTGDLGKLEICLQLRSIFNAIDGFNTYSNIAGRICIDDMLQNRDQVVKIQKGIIDDLKTRENDNPSDEYRLATFYFNNSQTTFRYGTLVNDDVWKRTAVREIREELGLHIKPSRLTKRKLHTLESRNLYFTVFSLRIDDKELDSISSSRPHANIARQDVDQIKQLHKKEKLNRLLQNEYEIFEEIFAQLEREFEYERKKQYSNKNE